MSKRLLDYPQPWIPIEEGELPCFCCGNHWDCEPALCGIHAYCSVCIGRGHGYNHDCAGQPASEPFRRLEHDCPGCGERHEDWETCANEVWRRYQKSKEQKS